MTCRYGKSREVVRRRRVLAIRRVSSSGRMFAKSLSALPLSDTNQPRQHARDTRAEPDASLGPHRASPRTSHSPEPGTGRAASARPLSLGLRDDLIAAADGLSPPLGSVRWSMVRETAMTRHDAEAESVR